MSKPQVDGKDAIAPQSRPTYVVSHPDDISRAHQLAARLVDRRFHLLRARHGFARCWIFRRGDLGWARARARAMATATIPLGGGGGECWRCDAGADCERERLREERGGGRPPLTRRVTSEPLNTEWHRSQRSRDNTGQPNPCMPAAALPTAARSCAGAAGLLVSRHGRRGKGEGEGEGEGGGGRGEGESLRCQGMRWLIADPPLNRHRDRAWARACCRRDLTGPDPRPRAPNGQLDPDLGTPSSRHEGLGSPDAGRLARVRPSVRPSFCPFDKRPNTAPVTPRRPFSQGNPTRHQSPHLQEAETRPAGPALEAPAHNSSALAVNNDGGHVQVRHRDPRKRELSRRGERGGGRKGRGRWDRACLHSTVSTAWQFNGRPHAACSAGLPADYARYPTCLSISSIPRIRWRAR